MNAGVAAADGNKQVSGSKQRQQQELLMHRIYKAELVYAIAANQWGTSKSAHFSEREQEQQQEAERAASAQAAKSIHGVVPADSAAAFPPVHPNC